MWIQIYCTVLYCLPYCLVVLYMPPPQRNDLAAGKSILFWALPFRGQLEGLDPENRAFLGPAISRARKVGPEKSSLFWALPFRGQERWALKNQVFFCARPFRGSLEGVGPWWTNVSDCWLLYRKRHHKHMDLFLREIKRTNSNTVHARLILVSKLLCYVTIIYSRKHQSSYITMPAFIFIIYKIKTFHIIEWTCRYYVGTQINDDIKIFPFSFSDVNHVIVYYPHLLHIYRIDIRLLRTKTICRIFILKHRRVLGLHRLNTQLAPLSVKYNYELY